MIIGGMVQKDAAKSLEKPLRTIQRWWARYRRGQGLGHKGGTGRPKTVTRGAKIVISKSLGKFVNLPEKSRQNSSKRVMVSINQQFIAI